MSTSNNMQPAHSSEMVTDFNGSLTADRQQTIDDLANAFHEVWLRTRNVNEDGHIMADGTRIAREKNTKDADWSARNEGATVVDIANNGYVDLPDDWKAENEGAAQTIIDLIEQMGGIANIDLDNPDDYQRCGHDIHAAWLERNSWAKDGELGVDFAELSPEEQAKDLEQLKLALELFKPDETLAAGKRAFGTRVLHTVNNWALERNLPMRGVNGKLIMPESGYYADQRDLLRSGYR